MNVVQCEVRRRYIASFTWTSNVARNLEADATRMGGMPLADCAMERWLHQPKD